MYGIVLQNIPNSYNALCGGPQQNSEGVLGAWHDHSEAMHIMEFVSECMSLCSLYMLGIDQNERQKASCLIRMTQRDIFSLKIALIGMVIFNLTKG